MERYELCIDTLSVSSLKSSEGRLANSVPQFLYPKEDIPQARMMREKLNLARTIEEHIVL